MRAIVVIEAVLTPEEDMQPEEFSSNISEEEFVQKNEETNDKFESREESTTDLAVNDNQGQDFTVDITQEEDMQPEEFSSKICEEKSFQQGEETDHQFRTLEGLVTDTAIEDQGTTIIATESLTQISDLPPKKPTDKINGFSLKRSDPYSGYDNPRPSKKRKQRKKKTPTPIEEPDYKYENVIVKYTRDTMPIGMQKYYNQRYDYFSKFDEGILMDKEGWFSVTPERIASQIANRCQSDIIIDAFCGCGGNSIQFAMTCNKVIAIDLDPVKIHCARENAKIYGVEDRIEFILGNFFDLAPTLKADVVFLSPPWGGPSYTSADIFDLKSMIPGDGTHIFQIASNITSNVAYFVPRNTDPQQLALLAGPGNTCEIQINSLCNRPKALTSYYGDLIDYDLLEQYEEEQEEADMMNTINYNFVS
ncbi:unnamed protein product [Rhizopus stolonifer]